MRTHHVIPIRQSHYRQVTALLEAGQLRHDPAAQLQRDRPAGPVYRPTQRTGAEPLTETLVRVGPHRIATELWRLPTAEATAVRGHQFAPDVRIQTLSAALTAGLTRAELCTLLDHPPTGVPAHEEAQETQVQAAWCPEAWGVMRLGRHWFMVLWFDLTSTVAQPPVAGHEVALDIGLVPTVQLVTAAGQARSIHPALPADLPGLHSSLNGPARQLLDRAVFAHYRRTLLDLTETLTREATAVYVEALTYGGMHRPFVRSARRTGVLDWHEGWLHTRLRLAGVRFERVDPAGTSRRCSGCDGHPYGERRGPVFVCRFCGEADAHLNAARNILRLGRAKAATWDALVSGASS